MVDLLTHEGHKVGGEPLLYTTRTYSWAHFICREGENRFEWFEFDCLRWLQLHAYQSPAVVRALRAAIPGELTIVKVVHLHAGRCLERRFIPSYERAGTDLFLLDAVTEDGRIGSTGQQLRGSDVIDLVPALTRPFLLAGGISAHNRADYESVVEHPQFFGIDVDTAARDDRGRFELASVTDLTRGWRTACYHREIA